MQLDRPHRSVRRAFSRGACSRSAFSGSALVRRAAVLASAALLAFGAESVAAATPPSKPAPGSTTPPGGTAPSAPAAPRAPSAPAAPSGPATLPADLVRKGELPKAPNLGEVMKVSKVGERITFTARVAGRANPFVAGRAMMIVSDPSLKPCNEREDDQCPTPADLCCETKETLRMNTATVQVVDAKGRVIPVALSGVEGLAALDHVVVEGILVERGDKGGFVVNATRVIRRQP